MMHKQYFFSFVMVGALVLAPQQAQATSLADAWNTLSVEAKCLVAVPVVIGGLVVSKALYESLPWVKARRENDRKLEEKRRQEEARLFQEALIKNQKESERKELGILNKQLDSLEHDCLVFSMRMTELLALSGDSQLFITRLNEDSCFTTETLVNSFNELKNASRKLRESLSVLTAHSTSDHSSSYFPQDWHLFSTRLEQEGVHGQVENTLTLLTKVIAQIKQLPAFATELAAVEKRAFLAETKTLLERQVAAYVKAQTALEMYERERARAEQLRLEAEIARLSVSLNNHYSDLFGAAASMYFVDVQSELNVLVYTASIERENAVRAEERRLAAIACRQAEEARKQADIARQQAEKARLQAERAKREREIAERARKLEETCRKDDQARQAKADEAAQKKAAEEKKPENKQRDQERQEQYVVYHDFWN